MLDFPIGAILAYPVPGTRFGSWHGETGEPHLVPAVVLGQFSDEAIKLFVLHFEGQFQAIVPAATAAGLEVLYDPREFRRLAQEAARSAKVLADMQGQIDGLLQIVKHPSFTQGSSVEESPKTYGEIERPQKEPLYRDMTPAQAPKLSEDEPFLPVRKHPQRARAAMGGLIPPLLESKD